MRQVIQTDKAPTAPHLFSQANVYGDLIFSSGQVGTDPATGKLAEGVAEQTRQAIENLQAVLEAAGSDLSKVLKANIYLKNIEDYATMNEVYTSFFSAPMPSRTALSVANLPLGALVEIEVIAHK